MSAFHNSPLPSSFDSLLLSKIKMSAFTHQTHQDIPLPLPLPPQQSSFQFHHHHHHLPQTPSPIDYHSPTTAVADTAAFKTHSAASSTLLHSIHTKRKNGDHGSSSASAHSPSQDAIESAGDSKHRKCNNIGSGSGTRAGGGRKPTTHKKLEAEEPPAPAGYIHVRARRGQATDSHSLAERIRREKISERMKVLQTLVPGCDKVTGKALMLDEIINYVQSLQNQVEFLSMKLASANPILYDFGMDPEVYIGRPEILNGMVSQLAELPYMPPCNTFQATADAPTTASSLPLITAGNSFIPQENPCPLLLEQEQHGNSCLVHVHHTL